MSHHPHLGWIADTLSSIAYADAVYLDAGKPSLYSVPDSEDQHGTGPTADGNGPLLAGREEVAILPLPLWIWLPGIRQHEHSAPRRIQWRDQKGKELGPVAALDPGTHRLRWDCPAPGANAAGVMTVTVDDSWPRERIDLTTTADGYEIPPTKVNAGVALYPQRQLENLWDAGWLALCSAGTGVTNSQGTGSSWFRQMLTKDMHRSAKSLRISACLDPACTHENHQSPLPNGSLEPLMDVLFMGKPAKTGAGSRKKHDPGLPLTWEQRRFTARLRNQLVMASRNSFVKCDPYKFLQANSRRDIDDLMAARFADYKEGAHIRRAYRNLLSRDGHEPTADAVAAEVLREHPADRVSAARVEASLTLSTRMAEATFEMTGDVRDAPYRAGGDTPFDEDFHRTMNHPDR